MIINKFKQQFIVKWWKDEQLSDFITIDTETQLITSPAIIPNLILTTVYDGSGSVFIVKNDDIFKFIEKHNKATFCMYNAAFDIPVLEQAAKLPLFDTFIQNGRLLDGQILFRLHSIATEGMEAKKWSLDYVTELITKEILDKNEDIRLTFGQYQDNVTKAINYSKISEDHLKYACLDPIATYICTKKILEKIKQLPTTTNLAHNINLVGDIALAQVTRNGIHIDQERVLRIRAELESDKVKNEEILATYGYIKGKKGNTKILENICKQENFALPVTETGKMCVAKQYLEDYKKHPFIDAYLKFKGFSKTQNFLNDLNTEKVYPRYNSLKVTTRTSCTRPNVQNMPRIGGIRECFIAKPGHVFLDLDYSAIELAAISAINLKLFKFSIMADLINQGKDLHTYAASKIYKISEEEVSKEQRQFAKIANFGFVAAMSAQTFISHAAKFGITISLEDSSFLRSEWVKVFPEFAKYWKRGYGRTTILTDSGLIRSNCSYTEALNFPMQSRVAEGAKLALYNLMKSNYKVVAFIHDQVIIEHAIEGAEQSLKYVMKIMIDSMSMVIKGVTITMSGEICERFKK